MNVCIFCSANDVPDVYARPARELVVILADRGDTLVWGGSNTGLMKAMADEFQNSGGRIVGITMERLKAAARPNADEMIVAPDIATRKKLMLEKADAIVMLVGGIGSLDEVTEMVQQKKQGDHDKPIIVLNTNGFYDGLKFQFERVAADGFLPNGSQSNIKVRKLEDFIQFAETPEEVIRIVGSVTGS